MNKIKDGDVYKIINIQGRVFELKYGFYEEYEKDSSDPIPIYPDFLANPEYTDEGIPFVSGIQTACGGFDGKDRELGCYGCKYFSEYEDLIGLCRLESNRRRE